MGTRLKLRILSCTATCSSSAAEARAPWRPSGRKSSTLVRGRGARKGRHEILGLHCPGMDALNIVAVPGISTPELYVEANRMACEGIMDEPPVTRWRGAAGSS